MNVPAKAAKHSAAGNYLGYSLQPIRLTFHLLTSPKGSSVSLEHLDDVAVHYPDGNHLYEQVKSSIGSSNPVSDWAADLWKAFANWLDDPLSLNSDVSIQYRIYVSPQKSGALLRRLHIAESEKDVNAIVAAVEKKIKAEPNHGSAAHIRKFIDADPAVRLRVVKNFSVSPDTGDPVADLLSRLVIVGAEFAETVARWAVGTAKDSSDSLIKAKKPAALSADEFKESLRSYVRSNYLPGVFISYSPEPSSSTIGSVLATRPTFIRQLELVKAEHHHLVGAVSAFLRSKADKTQWAERGDLYDPHYTEWSSSLIKRHQFIDEDIKITQSGLSLEDKGRLLYVRCANSSESLEGRVVPLYFVTGCFNDMADNSLVGWHANYLDLLKE